MKSDCRTLFFDPDDQEDTGVVRVCFGPYPIAKMILPGDIPARRKKPNVIALGDSFASSGGQPAEPPIIDADTKALVAGRDRIAACINQGVKEPNVVQVRGSKQDLEILTLVENANRRHSDGEQAAAIAKLVRLYAARKDVPDEPKKPWRPANPAIAATAAITGKSTEAVRSAVRRAAAKESESEVKEAAENEEKPAAELVIQTLGLDVPDKIVERTALLRAYLDGLRKALVRMQSDTTKWENANSCQYDEVRSSIHSAAATVASCIPASVCPHCKLTKLQAGCLACKGKGWVTALQLRSVEERLTRVGYQAGVYVDGRWTRLVDL